MRLTIKCGMLPWGLPWMSLSPGFLDMQGSSPCPEELTSRPGAPDSVGLGKFVVLMCHAPAWPTEGVADSASWLWNGMGCSASAPVRLWGLDKFRSWLVVLARGICWPQAKARMVTRAEERPGLPFARESPRSSRAPEPQVIIALAFSGLPPWYRRPPWQAAKLSFLPEDARKCTQWV
jgi:hypothetical protein